MLVCRYLCLCRSDECVFICQCDWAPRATRLITFSSYCGTDMSSQTSLPLGNQLSPDKQELMGLRISRVSKQLNNTHRECVSLWLVMTLIMVITCCYTNVFWVKSVKILTDETHTSCIVNLRRICLSWHLFSNSVSLQEDNQYCCGKMSNSIFNLILISSNEFKPKILK